MDNLVLVFIACVALGLVAFACLPVLRRMLTRCPECKSSKFETRDDANEFTGRTYRQMTCFDCGHQWSRRLWLQTNNGTDTDYIGPRPEESIHLPPPITSHTEDKPIFSHPDEPDDPFGGGSSGGGGAGSSW